MSRVPSEPTALRSGRVTPQRGHGSFWPSFFVTVVVLAGVLVLAPGASGYRVRALLGFDDRLNDVVDVPARGGQFRFELTQPGSDEPVSYDPCREIRYVVNPTGAPPDHEAMVQQAVAQVSRATGFRFTHAGVTDERDFEGRGAGGFRTAPVLIGWATPEEVPALAGDVAGLGGSSAVERIPGRLTFVTGKVVLDRDYFAEAAGRPQGFELERAIVMHELAHVVGLDHVEDPNELMFAGGVGRASFGRGDLEGLALLGAVDCG